MKRRPGGLGRGLDALFPSRPSGAPDAPAPASPRSAPGASSPAPPDAPASPPAPDADAPAAAGAVQLPVAAIAPNPGQPRTRIAPDELADLAASLRVHGVLQPIIVARAAPPPTAPSSDSPQDWGAAGAAPGGTPYILIAGERRWRAAQLAGLATIPALVKDVTPRERLELALVENVQRQDLTPLEEAAAYRQLVADHGLTQEAVAERVGKSRVAVANALRLLHLAPAIHAALTGHRITAGHARALLGAPDTATQEALLARVLAEELSVRATEELVRRGARPAADAPGLALLDDEALAVDPFARPDADETLPPSPPMRAPSRPTPGLGKRAESAQSPSPDVAAWERELRDALGTKVQLYRSRRGGRIIIHYFSDDQLQGLYDRLTAEP